jgi:hypothetical protein
MVLDESLIVIHAGNSQGKTSFSEALEFLICGHCSRRELLGGAKAEYHDSLRNAYMPAAHREVFVAAGVRGPDGSVHEVRRELLRDFGSGSECTSRLTVDGVPRETLNDLGLPVADPPVRAPVLLQHTLRHVLSTEPKQRVGYFKALLSLNDLDVLRNRIAVARAAMESRPFGETLAAARRLAATAVGPAMRGLEDLADAILDEDQVQARASQVILEAGQLLLGEKADSVSELQSDLETAISSSSEASFPLRSFAGSPLADHRMSAPELAEYSTAIEKLDREAAQLMPLFSAVLALDEISSLDHPIDCPVCATPSALSPARIAALREQVLRSSGAELAAAAASRSVDSALGELSRLAASLAGVIPAARSWNEQQVQQASEQLRELGLDGDLSAGAHLTAAGIDRAVSDCTAEIQTARAVLEQARQSIARREPTPGDIAKAYASLSEAIDEIRHACQEHGRCERALRQAVEPALTQKFAAGGSVELLHLATHIDQLCSDLRRERSRRQAVQRLAHAEKALSVASGKVLDKRFRHMSDTIAAWWDTIRPEERVGFAGMRRRAAGALFVDLVAALRADPHAEAVERNALGIYSDSQLNALGLSIFLARSQLLGAPFVVLDDPIPGSDPDHRLTFAQNTLGALLDNGTQVILATFDNKLAEWAQVNHDHRGLISYELTLVDPVTGTEPIQTSDAFSRFMLEAEDNLNAPTPRGRRAACGSFRSAAERLAKQIIATGRVQEGSPCTVADMHREASMLGDLVPLVCAYALGNDEKGQWRTFAKVLNPGNHDDDVPSTTELKQVRGNLRAIAKAHGKHWPGGLII